MEHIFTIENLNYSISSEIFFDNFNLSIEKGSFTSIIAPNKSGKSMLTKIICAIYPTYDKCFLDGIALNKENVLLYITKIGIVSNDFRNPFLYKKVRDELEYPLLNLGYSEYKISKVIEKIAYDFSITDILDDNIDSLSESTRSKLQIIISLVHGPKLLVLDDIFNNMTLNDQVFILEKLKELNKKGLTILNITSKLDTIYDSDKVYLMNKFKIENSYSVSKIFNEDTLLTKLGFEIPFIVNLSLKLKDYGLIDKVYYHLIELEEKLWK